MKTIKINGQYINLLKLIRLDTPLEHSYRASNDDGQSFWIYGTHKEVSFYMFEQNATGGEYENSELYCYETYYDLRDHKNIDLIFKIAMKMPFHINFPDKKIVVINGDQVEHYSFNDLDSFINNIIFLGNAHVRRQIEAGNEERLSRM